MLGLVAGLLAIYLLASWRWQKEIDELLYIAAGVGLLSVLFKKVALWIALFWMGLGQLMGKVVGTMLLTVVFLLMLTPLAKLQALFSKPKKFKSGGDVGGSSSWIDRKHAFVRKDLEELW